MNLTVRFSPSPTGALHIGSVRTALFNYLLAKQKNGKFLLRIEDTDQKRFDPNSEKHIFESLQWLGIEPDESPIHGIHDIKYRQTEREYQDLIQNLIDNGHAYYAFDTEEELNSARERWKVLEISSGYSTLTRNEMKNSLTIPSDEVKMKIINGDPYVIRFKMPKDRIVKFVDGVRGSVEMNTKELDDKVLMKSNKIPTYHGANVIDDHLMNITDVIRGEEWLTSTPLHILIYEAFGWDIPKFYHLPLILDKDGKKFSKRTALKQGISIFALNWTGYDEDSDEFKTILGFKEIGYEKEALLNYLVLLGWHPTDNKEILSLSDMIEKFDINDINKSGAKFDVDKLNFINSYYVRNLPSDIVLKEVNADMTRYDCIKLESIVSLIKERAIFRKDFIKTAKIFFSDIENYEDLYVIDDISKNIFGIFIERIDTIEWTKENIKMLLINITNEKGIKLGKIMPAFRMIITGCKSGPDLMTTCEILGKDIIYKRINFFNETY